MRTHEGDSPLVISVPHAGTMIPPSIRERMHPEVLFLPDTDWFVDKLYEWAPSQGASLVVTPWSRYVIDLNRPLDNAPLYANHSGSSLVPVQTFNGEEIYKEGHVPDEEEIAQRIGDFWVPYHEHLSSLIDAAKQRYGHAILLDGHSIRSVVPELFEGELPHLNLGTNEGASASAELAGSAWALLKDSEFSAVRDERFKGGFITRNYGQPGEQVHALQLEVAQRAYMPEEPPQWDRNKAAGLMQLLQELVARLQVWQPGSGNSHG